jgi:predicted ATPase
MLRRFVLTGAPGAGKTALAVALRDRGYVIVAEAATDVIADEHAHGIAEPWRNGGFLDDIVRLQRQRQLAPIAGDLQVQVYDRSPLCTLALARYLQRPVTPLLAEEVARVIDERIYEPTVFFVRPLGFIAPTPARRISYEESLRFEAIHEAVYHEHGFQLVDVPAGTINQRAATVDTYIRSQASLAPIPEIWERASPRHLSPEIQRQQPPEITDQWLTASVGQRPFPDSSGGWIFMCFRADRRCRASWRGAAGRSRAVPARLPAPARGGPRGAHTTKPQVRC